MVPRYYETRGRGIRPGWGGRDQEKREAVGEEERPE